MTSLRTCFRAVIMLAVVGSAVKTWQLYGPSGSQLQAVAQRVVEVADELLSEYRQPAAMASTDFSDPRLQSPGYATPLQSPPIHVEQPVLLASAEIADSTSAPAVASAQQAVALIPESASPATPLPVVTGVEPVHLEATPNGEARLQAATMRLTQLGVRDQQLQPWGHEAALYRFSCSAPWVDAPNYSRHFESVAADPATAVEQVAAEIDAWQTAQSTATLRR